MANVSFGVGRNESVGTSRELVGDLSAFLRSALGAHT